MNLSKGLLLDNKKEIKWHYPYEKVLELLSSYTLIKEEDGKNNYKSVCINTKTLGLEKILRTKFSFVNNKLIAVHFSKCDNSAYNLQEIIDELTVILGIPDSSSKNNMIWHFGRVVLKYSVVRIDDHFNEYLEINV